MHSTMKALISIMASISSVSAIAVAYPAEPATSSPFHECLDTGKTWAACHLEVSSHFEMLRRDALPQSNSPFHDCLDTGKSWADCRLIVRDLSVDAEPTSALAIREADATVEERAIPTIISGIIKGLNVDFGMSEKCYSVNNLGDSGWLTTTAVKKIKTQACTFAVNQALSAAAAKAGPVGKFTSKVNGFYQGPASPISLPGVKFYLSTFFQNDFADLQVPDLHTLGIDLCVKGVDHLIADKGCTAARKAGAITQHTSVNGGEFGFGHTGSVAVSPKYDTAGLCVNCIMSMVMEASNWVSKDGSTATEIDS